MKITNNNIRAAKRTVYRQHRGSCGGIPAGFVFEDEFLQNRTHEKSENAAYDRKSDSTAPTP